VAPPLPRLPGCTPCTRFRYSRYFCTAADVQVLRPTRRLSRQASLRAMQAHGQRQRVRNMFVYLVKALVVARGALGGLFSVTGIG